MAQNKTPRKDWLKIATLDDALSHGLTEAEYRNLLEVLGREINLVELGVCSALYSEHCSYKSTRVHLKTLPTEGPRVIQGPGENAGVVDIGDNQAVVFKVESHNHPTFIEPYQGAATGVGGILRDVFTMGARPIALMNALRFGEISNARTKYLVSRAVQGIGGYGNCMGIPTVGGELYFHESYNGNCLVNAFALGLVEHDKVFLGSASGIGNAVLYVGSKTGRDGIHGASMASESFDDDSESKRPTVQVGDPFQEKLLLEACLEAMASGYVVGIQDMGAAGMTSSTYEMADRAGNGVRIDLDLIPHREEGMNPYELMLSESQERMLVVVQAGKEQELCKIFQHWELDAVKIGEVIAGTDVELYWHGELISSIPAAILTRSVPQYRWPEKAPADFAVSDDAIYEPNTSDRKLLEKRWLALLGSVNCCSRAPVFRQYDSTVRTNTVIHPGGDAAVVRVKREQGDNRPEKGIAMSLDCNSRYCAADPRQGTALSLAEGQRNLAAVGAFPIGISDNLNFGSPQKPEGMWQIAESVRGLGEAARAFDIPIVSGNVSLYNETKGKAILPTPLLALVGLINDASLCVVSNFTEKGDVILVVGQARQHEMRASEYSSSYPANVRGRLPLLDYDLESRTCGAVRSMIAKRLLQSCHDISNGGLALALSECCLSVYGIIGSSIKAELELLNSEEELFCESGARFIISCKAENEKEIRRMLAQEKLAISYSGVVGGEKIEIKEVASIALTAADNAWRNGLEDLFAVANTASEAA